MHIPMKFRDIYKRKEYDKSNFESKDREEEERDYTSLIILGAIAACLILWAGGSLLTHWYAKTYFSVGENENAPALFGDSFGSVNALISAFAFAGVIVAIFIQRNELKLQRKDLGYQRQEFITQNETLKLQRFENTFFNMMSLQQQIVNDLSYEIEEKKTVFEDSGDIDIGTIRKEIIVNKTIRGRELFSYLFMEEPHYVELTHDTKQKAYGLRGYLFYVGGPKAYEESYATTYFDHYFRHLYTIIKFVDGAEFLNFDEKYKYISMVRATLSRYELVWLFYNCIYGIGKVKFKKLIERYSILKEY